MSWAWSDAFKQALAANRVPGIWYIQAFQVWSEATFNSAGNAYVASNDARYGDPILCGPPTMSGSRVSIDSWSSTIGGCSFDLAGDLTRFRANVTRGTAMAVYLVAGGEAGRMLVGRVTSLSYARGRLTLSIGDALTLLDGRSVTSGDDLALFQDLLPGNIASTTTTADFELGVDTTLDVVSTAGFDAEDGGTGAILVGDTLLTWTGNGSTSFSGLPLTAQFGSSAEDPIIVSGTAVKKVALLQGHPLALALKVLTSTGAAVHAHSYDLLPDAWGFGLSMDLVAYQDVEMEISEVMHLSAGSYQASILVTEAQPDPRAWLTGWLSAFGCFLVMREGCLSIRAATLDLVRHRDIRRTLTDADIDPSVGVSSDWWDSTKAAEAGRTSVYSASVQIPETTGEDLQTLPGTYDDPIDMSAVLYDYTYEGEVMTEVYDRLFRFKKRVCELLTLPIAGLGCMDLCPGDRITFVSTLQSLRFSYAGLGREVWILQVTPDPQRGSVTLRGISWPSDTGVFSA